MLPSSTDACRFPSQRREHHASRRRGRASDCRPRLPRTPTPQERAPPAAAAVAAAASDRPGFHVAPPSGWVNDPNGPLLYNGIYHLCASQPLAYNRLLHKRSLRSVAARRMRAHAPAACAHSAPACTALTRPPTHAPRSFYQHVPGSATWQWGLCWGHAVSSDLVHWTHLPPALAPTPGSLDQVCVPKLMSVCMYGV